MPPAASGDAALLLDKNFFQLFSGKVSSCFLPINKGPNDRTSENKKENEMAAMNKVYLMGHLTKEPELKSISSGQSVLKFGVAVNEVFRGQDGAEKKSTLFMDVDVWGKQAEPCGKYLAKGALVMVEGRLHVERWESKQGEKRSRTVVRADRVHFLPSASNGGKKPDKREDRDYAHDE